MGKDEMKFTDGKLLQAKRFEKLFNHIKNKN